MSKHRDDPTGHVWHLVDSIRTAMLVTWDGERQRARPMAATADREHHAIWFLTDADSAKDHQIEQFPVVALTFADKGGNDYLALTGRAEVLNDREKIAELFSPFAKAWWDGPDDPAIRVIRVTPEDAEYWDGPGGPLAAVRMLAAAATGGEPDMGENRKVSI